MHTRCPTEPASARWLIPCLAVGLLLTSTGAASAKTLLKATFDTNTSSLSGKQGFQSKYCKDPWTTALNGGVFAKTDDGCPCTGSGGSNCDYAVYTAQGNSCYKSEPVDNILVTGNAAWTDYAVTVRFRNLDNDTVGLVFRYKNTANYYAIWLSQDTGPGTTAACDGSFKGARLVRVASTGGSGGGKATTIAASPTTYVQGKVHLLRVRVEGKSIVVHFDANADGKLDADKELLFNAADTTHASGSVGLYAYQNGAAPGSSCAKGGCWFDDLVVEELEGGGGSSSGGTSSGGTSSGGDAGGGSSGGVIDAGGGSSGGVIDAGGGSSGGGDAGVIDTASPDTGKPDTGKPDTGKPDSAKTDATQVDAPKADGGQAGVSPDGVSADGAGSQPLTLTVVGGDDDSGCAAGPRGAPTAPWLLLVCVLMLGLRRRVTG